MRNYWDYVREFAENQEKTAPGVLLRVDGIGRKDAYNPALIEEEGTEYLALRVESPESFWLDTATYDPEIRFFRQEGEAWVPAPGTPVFPASEDPTAAWITEDGQRRLVLGRVVLDRSGSQPEVVTEFFVADSVAELRPDHPVARIRGMKDIRLLQLPGGDIAVCGRPVGGAAGRGRVSFLRVSRLADLTTERLAAAPLLAMDLDAPTKVGSNALYLLPGADPDVPDIGVLGHLAVGRDEVGLHYAAATWRIDLATGKTSNPAVLALRSDFQLHPAKLHWISDVMFPGALQFREDGTVLLYAGLSDSRLGILSLPDPFSLFSQQ